MQAPRTDTTPTSRPDGRPRPHRARREPGALGEQFSQRGAALIAVTLVVTMLGLVVSEFSTSTNIDMFAAENAENDMKAHFAARSGMNLSRLIIKLQTDVVDKFFKEAGIQISDYTGMLMGAFSGSKDELESLSALVGGFDVDNAKGLGMPGGVSFDLNITTEDGKLNLNCAKDGVGSDPLQNPRGPGDYLFVQLASMIYPDAYNPIFENEDAEGYRRDRETQVAAVIDYIDTDSARAGSPGAPEDYGYESLDDKYKPKNQPLDTTGEIALIRGIDDRFWNLFGGSFTVYGGCKINVGALSSPSLIYAIITLSLADPNDPILQNPAALWALARLVAQAAQMGIPIVKKDALKELVRDPLAVLNAGSSLDPNRAPIQIPPEFASIEGVELNDAKLDAILTDDVRRTYRVETTASVKVGQRVLEKRIVGIWDTKPRTQQSRDPSATNGAWVFWRED